jgi:hypothetical protein
MSKVSAIKLEGFVGGFHQPYTDYDQEIVNWLNCNGGEFLSMSFVDNYLFSGKGGNFYSHIIISSQDVYYTPEEFKAWIGMTKQEEKGMFTKADLKDGMIVETRNSGNYIVVGNILVGLQCGGSWNNLVTCYNDNLLAVNNKCFDIIGVYTNAHPYNDLRNLSICADLKLLWERVEQTPEQIEAEAIRLEMEKLTERLKKLEGK